MIHTLAIATLLTIAHTASAQNWAEEPASVFGLKLGEPIASSNIPACPPRDSRTGLPKTLCLERGPGPYAETMATLNALPINEAYSGTTHLTDGFVASLHIEVNHDNYAKFRAILVERYGKPTKAAVSTVTSNRGAVLPAETLEWNGHNNRLQLFERFDRIDRSLAVFSNNALVQKETEKRANKIKDSASKF